MLGFIQSVSRTILRASGCRVPLICPSLPSYCTLSCPSSAFFSWLVFLCTDKVDLWHFSIASSCNHFFFPSEYDDVFILCVHVLVFVSPWKDIAFINDVNSGTAVTFWKRKFAIQMSSWSCVICYIFKNLAGQWHLYSIHLDAYFSSCNHVPFVSFSSGCWSV